MVGLLILVSMILFGMWYYYRNLPKKEERLPITESDIEKAQLNRLIREKVNSDFPESIAWDFGEGTQFLGSVLSLKNAMFGNFSIYVYFPDRERQKVVYDVDDLLGIERKISRPVDPVTREEYWFQKHVNSIYANALDAMRNYVREITYPVQMDGIDMEKLVTLMNTPKNQPYGWSVSVADSNTLSVDISVMIQQMELANSL